MPGHTFLYSPPVNCIRDLIEVGRPRRHLLHLDEPGEPRSPPAATSSVALDLGPHDFSILRYWLEETPRYVTAVSRGFVVPADPGRRVHQPRLPRRPIAHVELSWLAPSKLRRTTIVGSRRCSSTTTRATSPCASSTPVCMLRPPETFGEYNAHLSHRRHRLAARPGGRAAAARDGRLLRRDPVRASPRSSRELGVEVVRMIEAVDPSLRQTAARIDLHTESALLA